MTNLSYDWNKIVEKVAIYTIDNEIINVSGENIRWSLAEQYPNCQPLDLWDYFDFKNDTPLLIYIFFKRVDNLGVTISIEDRQKAVSRTLKSNRLMYTGPSLSLSNLSAPIRHSSIISVSQLIDSELDADKNCKNYPFENFYSFKECDNDFIFNEAFSKEGVVPFWATHNFTNVTSLR